MQFWSSSSMLQSRHENFPPILSPFMKVNRSYFQLRFNDKIIEWIICVQERASLPTKKCMNEQNQRAILSSNFFSLFFFVQKKNLNNRIKSLTREKRYGKDELSTRDNLDLISWQKSIDVKTQVKDWEENFSWENTNSETRIEFLMKVSFEFPTEDVRLP
jgi:patatin-like phospholipase/acyl hydrolase